MADDVPLKDATDTTFTAATDDVGGKHYQIVKLAAGALDTATLVHAGAGTAANALRASLASDDPAVVALQIMDDWDEADRAKVNLIAGQAGITAGAGAVAANTPRVTHASDDPVTTALQIIDDWDETDRCKVNPISGQAGVQGGSGTVSATTQRVVLATDVALPAGTNLLGAVNVRPATANGWTYHNKVAAASTNATNVKASAGQVGGWYIYNNNASPRKVAFHNTSGTPTAGTSVVFSIIIPGNSAANVEFSMGIQFSTGIAYTMVTVPATPADSDSTAVAAGDLVMLLLYN